MIAEAAYFLAEKRAFVDGDMVDDWGVAEAGIDRLFQQNGNEKGENITVNEDEFRKLIQDAVDNDIATISEKVRAITLKALSGSGIDKESLKQVIAAVVDGAQRGAANRDKRGARALIEAIRGLDAALAAAAEATQLAILEAAGRTGEFSRQGMKRTTDDLAGLELLFIQTIADAARDTTGLARDTLRNMADHARARGTAVGCRIELALSEVAHAVADTACDQAKTGIQTLGKGGGLIASLAARMLRGIADRLQSAPVNKSTPPTSVKGS